MAKNEDKLSIMLQPNLLSFVLHGSCDQVKGLEFELSLTRNFGIKY